MIKKLLSLGVGFAITSAAALADEGGQAVSDDVIAGQRAALGAATEGKGFGPQSPRDIEVSEGSNPRAFSVAPAVTEMVLCDIHFHESAEHRGGEFTTFVGNGDGNGYGSGFEYDGELTGAEVAPIAEKIGEGENGDLVPGDTIEIHFVYSSALAALGSGLGTCFNDAIGNPQLRVEAVVAVLANSSSAVDFVEMARVEEIDGLKQAPNLPNNLGTPVVYNGSTTGPGYNKEGSPFHVTWSVRPKVVKLSILSVGVWLADNEFNEEEAHGVRNLVTNPDLLSTIE